MACLNVGKRDFGVLEYWSIGFKKGCCLVLFYHHSITPVLQYFHKVWAPSLWMPYAFKCLLSLFFNNKMHPPVFGLGRFSFTPINRLLFAKADGYEPFPFDAFAD